MLIGLAKNETKNDSLDVESENYSSDNDQEISQFNKSIMSSKSHKSPNSPSIYFVSIEIE